MRQQESSTFGYDMGFDEELLALLRRRHTAEASAGHLLPHLRPGLRLLDFGCGPGTISVGLAAAVEPGELHGVDVEPSQIDLARSLARDGGHENAIFHVADAARLPFEDGFFDVAHCHNALMHIADVQGALAEVKRVLKPGGIIACREMICGSSFSHPDFGVLRKAWDVFEDLLAAEDGHPQMGKDMKTQILEAGFVNIRMSASFTTYATPREIDLLYNIANSWFLSPEIMEAAIEQGAATGEMFEEIRSAYQRWKEHPSAFIAMAYGEAIAGKP